MKTAAPPPPDRNVAGEAQLDRVRLRQGLFGVTIERLWETQDGRRFWRKAQVGEIVEVST
jgi:hypothetical protein